MRFSRVSRLRTVWDHRQPTWHDHVNSSPAFVSIRDAVLEAAVAGPGDRVVDLGAGTGFLALEAASAGSHVIAVDFSSVMLDALRNDAAGRGLDNIETIAADLSVFDLPQRSVDVVMSSYALHHLRDPDKAALIIRAHGWLRPGGRIVIADMMFGRGGTAADRAIIATKIKRMARRGPAGMWRIAKNVVRFGLRRGSELPVPCSFWVDALNAAGFTDVTSRQLVAEAGLVTAVAGVAPVAGVRGVQGVSA